MATRHRVLVVGASGKLGAKIAAELVARGAGSVRVTHRAGSHSERLDTLRAAGAELVQADLGDAASLGAACDGIDVVVSAVQGLADVIVDGQTRLLRAAEASGSARLIPSDYALDFFKTPEGGNRNLDWRRAFNRTLEASSVRGSSVLCGAFMDLIAYGAIGPDAATGIYKVFGDPDQAYDFTLTDDLAKYVAAVALDDDAPRYVRVAGDTRSARELAAIFEAARGRPVTIESAGSLEDLTRIIDRMRAAGPREALAAATGLGERSRTMPGATFDRPTDCSPLWRPGLRIRQARVYPLWRSAGRAVLVQGASRPVVRRPPDERAGRAPRRPSTAARALSTVGPHATRRACACGRLRRRPGHGRLRGVCRRGRALAARARLRGRSRVS